MVVLTVLPEAVLMSRVVPLVSIEPVSLQRSTGPESAVWDFLARGGSEVAAECARPACQPSLIPKLGGLPCDQCICSRPACSRHLTTRPPW